MSAPRSLALSVYRLATAAGSLIAPAVLRSRAARGKEEPGRTGERLGRASRPRPDGRLAWLHGVSVGESLSLLPLIERLATDRPDVSVLITTGTRASAELLVHRLPANAVHQYAPMDSPAAVERFLGHWRPGLGVIVESELWPNLILGARGRGVKLALASAKLSARSLARWRMAPRLARVILGAFDLVLARDEAAADGFRGRGGRVDGLADLKFGAPPLPVDARRLGQLRLALQGRRVILAASTHDGEDGSLLDRFAAVTRPADRRALLVIAPRHPERGAAIESLAGARGFSATRAARQGAPETSGVFIADSIGELGLWYRLADLAFIGGSLVCGIGCHNPLEAARLNCPFVSGCHVENWPVYAELEARGATSPLAAVAEDLDRPFIDALEGAQHLRIMAGAARAFVEDKDLQATAIVERVLALMDP